MFKILKIGVLTILIISVTYIFYSLLNVNANEKLDKIKGNANYLEILMQRKIDAIIAKNKKTSEHIVIVRKLLNESSVKPFGFTINIYLYLIVSIFLSINIFSFSRSILNNVVAGMIIGCIAAMIPYELLKLEVEIKRRNIRKSLPNFFLVLSQLNETTDDITEVLEIATVKFKKSIRQPFKEFLTNLKSGKSVEDCTKILKSRFDNHIIIRFIDDMENNIQNGTQLKGALEEYTIISYNNEINYMERITENSGSIATTIMILGIFLYFVYELKQIRPEFVEILLYNPIGKITVVILILLLILASIIVKYSISYQDTK